MTEPDTNRKATKKPRYHHGNLREALLQAAEEMLNEGDAATLTLRAAAARAGVSHAAPSHHFGSLQGLLTAVATVGMHRFADALEAGHADNKQSAKAYITFARDNPGLFKLMFDASRLNYQDPDFMQANKRSRRMLSLIAKATLPDNATEQQQNEHELIVWARAHGYANLLLSGQLSLYDVGDDRLGMLDAVMGGMAV